MSYNGSGTFQINSSGQPVITGTTISSTVFNALTADLATGLSTAMTKDGQTTTTARIPFALGINSTLVTDATSITTGSIITAGGVGISKALYVGTTANVAGAVTLGGVATFSAQPIFTSLTASSAVATNASKGLVSVTNTGTGNNVLATTPTIATPSLTSPTISDGTANGVGYLNGSKVLTTGSTLAFDGTTLSTSGLTASGTITASGGTANGVGYLNGSKVLTTGSALVFDGTNLGVGVTPSAWTSPFKVIESGNGSTFQNAIAFQTNNNTINLMGNCYYDGNYRFKYGSGSATASQFVVNSNSYAWNLASGGTAGGVATFTQAMTLDASGQLGVGTTSPTAKLVSEVTGSTAQLKLTQSGFASYNFKVNTDSSLTIDKDGTTRLTVDTNGNFSFNSGYGSAAVAYGCRAWVNFNGTGTIAIRASGNVSSITDNGAGDYTLNFTTAMPDINYAVVASTSTDNSNFAVSINTQTSQALNVAPTTTTVRMQVSKAAVGYIDAQYVNVAIFR